MKMLRSVIDIPVLSIVLSLWLVQCDGFLMPVGHSVSAAVRSRNRYPVSKVGSRPGPMGDAWRRLPCMAVSRPRKSGSHAPRGLPTSDMAGEKPKSPFGRIARRITGMVWKVMLGSRPEKRSAAEAIVAARRVTETEVPHNRLGVDGMRAREAAERVVAAAENDGSTSGDLVQVDVGTVSPMEAQEMMASLRKRKEQGMQPDAEADARERQRQVHLRKERQQRMEQQRREKLGREASFPGDTAVAELSSRSENAPANEQRRRRPTPKMASKEDVERMERLFGSMGGEMLP